MRPSIWFLIAMSLVAPAQEPESTLHSTVNEVLLDVVVRDKKAHIIRDLRPEEVQVFEDGVPQKLRHFEFYDGRATPAAPAAAAPATATSPAPANAPNATNAPSAPNAPYSVQELRDIGVVSVVVANLNQEGRKVTLDTMRDFLKNEMRPNTYIGVFWLTRNGIRQVEPYNNDAEKISSAVLRAVNGIGLESPNQLARLTSGWEGDASEGLPLGNGQPGGGPGRELADLMSTQWIDDMQDTYQDSANYLSQLHRLVQSQAAIPGRKLVMLFSSGLPIHPDTIEVFNTVISTANRSNVSFYAIDTMGFGTPDLSKSRRMLAQAAQASMAQQLGGVSGGDQSVTRVQASSSEIAEASIRADTRGNLATLAEGTGGALLSTSMDLPKMLGRALEEVQTHYELSYSPLNMNADGRFRKIEVKVSRPGAVVFARSGYYALPLLNNRQIYPFEMATLNALNAKPAPQQFDFHAGAIQFRAGQRRTQFSFAFQVPTAGLTITEEKPWAKVHVAVTVLMKDEKGLVVQKISRDIPYQVPLEKSAELKRGVVTFTAPFLLPPGRYTLETAALDRENMKASVRRSALVVGQGSGLSMSDVVLVRRVDAVEASADVSDPLQAKGGKVTPELSGSVSQNGDGAVRFYAAAYPPAPVDAPVEVNLVIARDGQTVVRTGASAVPVEAGGAAPILVRVPGEKLPPGHYEAQITFQYKGQVVSNVAPFTVEAQ
jgi:VWFA-related protein